MGEIDIASGIKPAFEETMLIDTIRAMRRDRKEYVKKNQSKRGTIPTDP